MPTIHVTRPFLFAENGNRVIQIETGVQQVSDRCALVAVEHLQAATLPSSEPAADTKPRTRARK